MYKGVCAAPETRGQQWWRLLRGCRRYVQAMHFTIGNSTKGDMQAVWVASLLQHGTVCTNFVTACFNMAVQPWCAMLEEHAVGTCKLIDLWPMCTSCEAVCSGCCCCCYCVVITTLKKGEVAVLDVVLYGCMFRDLVGHVVLPQMGVIFCCMVCLRLAGAGVDTAL